MRKTNLIHLANSSRNNNMSGTSTGHRPHEFPKLCTNHTNGNAVESVEATPRTCYWVRFEIVSSMHLSRGSAACANGEEERRSAKKIPSNSSSSQTMLWMKSTEQPSSRSSPISKEIAKTFRRITQRLDKGFLYQFVKMCRWIPCLERGSFGHVVAVFGSIILWMQSLFASSGIRVAQFRIPLIWCDSRCSSRLVLREVGNKIYIYIL